MKQYVMGFFILGGTSVLLVKKKAGDPSGEGWNGVGGGVDGAETPAMAMAREWREETALEPVDWKDVGLATGKDHSYAIHLFVAEAAEMPYRVEGVIADMKWDTYDLTGDWRSIPFCSWTRTMLSMALEAEEAGDFMKNNCPHLSLPV
jgi:8-oxo-dGTP pyrophosphatase MutT (NUDIX family)